MGNIVAFRAERRRSKQGRAPADAAGRMGEIVLLPCVRRERLVSTADALEPKAGAGGPGGNRYPPRLGAGLAATGSVGTQASERTKASIDGRLLSSSTSTRIVM
jgi:hypothetical protein